MIQLEQQQHGEFVCGGVVADTNYLYPARWGWIKSILVDIFMTLIQIGIACNFPSLNQMFLVHKHFDKFNTI